MKKMVLLLFLCLFVTTMLVLPAGAQVMPPSAVDGGDLLTGEELVALSMAAQSASEASECWFAVATYRSNGYNDRYIGEDFMYDYNLSFNEDVVLLIVTYDGVLYYYDLYLYGDAERRITEDEVNRILDHASVYPVLKSGKICEGATAFLSLATEMYGNETMLKSPYLSALPAALVISVVIGVIACVCVKSKYAMKKRSVDYPLDRFAKFELTEQSDVFTGSFVTRRIVSTGNGGGRGVGGGRGGGRGHAGGR